MIKMAKKQFADYKKSLKNYSLGRRLEQFENIVVPVIDKIKQKVSSAIKIVKQKIKKANPIQFTKATPSSLQEILEKNLGMEVRIELLNEDLTQFKNRAYIYQVGLTVKEAR